MLVVFNKWRQLISFQMVSHLVLINIVRMCFIRNEISLLVTDNLGTGKREGYFCDATSGGKLEGQIYFAIFVVKINDKIRWNFHLRCVLNYLKFSESDS